MTSLFLSAFLLLQTGTARVVPGRLSVEGGAQAPSSFALQLTPGTGAARVVTLRPQIDGGFRLQVPPGEYQVGAARNLPTGYTLKSITYGGVDVLQNALKIAANDSAELLITLATSGPSPAVSVSGRVTGISPGQVQRISLREPTGGELAAALETAISSDGSFTFDKVLPGNYIVYFRLRAVTRVAVGSTNVTDVIVAVPQDILVSGHVIAEGVQTVTPAVTILGNGKPATSARGTGTFVLSLEKGENTIAVSGIPETHSLKSITYGDVDLQKENLKLDGPANWDIVVRLAPKN